MGRRRIYATDAERLKAHRERSEKIRVEIRLSKHTAGLIAVQAEELGLSLSDAYERLIKYALTNQPRAYRYASQKKSESSE